MYVCPHCGVKRTINPAIEVGQTVLHRKRRGESLPIMQSKISSAYSKHGKRHGRKYATAMAEDGSGVIVTRLN